jgi:hypothetical protein
MGVLVGLRAVLDAARHDEQLAFSELDIAITQLNRDPSTEHEEEVVGVVVPVPHELAVHFHHDELVVVEVPDDAGAERLVEPRELLARSTLSIT